MTPAECVAEWFAAGSDTNSLEVLAGAWRQEVVDLLDHLRAHGFEVVAISDHSAVTQQAQRVDPNGRGAT